MAKIFGSEHEIFFGDVEEPLPDWRQELPPSTDDDTLTPEERKALIAILGFDPAELED